MRALCCFTPPDSYPVAPVLKSKFAFLCLLGWHWCPAKGPSPESKSISGCLGSEVVQVLTINYFQFYPSNNLNSEVSAAPKLETLLQSFVGSNSVQILSSMITGTNTQNPNTQKAGAESLTKPA